MPTYTYPFKDLDNSKVGKVGGKNASLGEMFQELTEQGIKIPDGFATSADAYWEFLSENNLKEPIQEELDKLDKKDFSNLGDVGETIRKMVMKAKVPENIAKAIKAAYRDLKDREDNRFDHMKIALSAGVQKMVRADKACAGVAFTIEPETGFDRVIFINGSWGLGDNVVGGVVRADEFYLYKENLKNDKLAILSKELGTKKKTLIYSDKKSNKGQHTKNTDTPQEKQKKYILSDDEVQQLGKWCLKIEEHYGKAMDIEWAKDGNSGEIFIVQARPETVHSSKKEKNKLKQYSLKNKGKVIVSGNGIGDKIAAGKARLLKSPKESDKLQDGDILVTEITNPDWDPIIKKAAAIITSSGGRTSHAAIVARELGAVAVVGAEGATERIKDGQEITVSCAGGQDGKIYDGILEWDEEEIEKLTATYENKETYFIEQLSMAVGTMAASFYPREVIVRMSDFLKLHSFW